MAGGVENLEQKYRYNGKELQEETRWLDYGARMYDAQIGRFYTQDPCAESYYLYSSYNYVGGNPIKRVDENGEFWNNVVGCIDGADVLLAGGEGFLTSGASALKSFAVKATVTVVKNSIDVKMDGEVNVHSTEKVIKDTGGGHIRRFGSYSKIKV